MELDKFIAHIKHRSCFINIFEDAHLLFIGTIGEYLTSVIRGKIGDSLVEKIEPLTNDFNIFVRLDVPEEYKQMVKMR